MADLIERSAVLHDLDTLWDYSTVDGIAASTVLKQVMTDVQNVPAVDAVPVEHGHWIGLKHDGEYGYSVQTSLCSVCGQDVIRYVAYDTAPATVEINYDYCPNCGAKMDGKRREGET